MKRRSILSVLAGIAFAIAAVNAFAQDIQQQLSAASTLEDIKKRGTIRVGFSTFVPWAMRNSKGEFIGFEIDVADKLAKDNGWTVEHIPTAWDGIIPALLAKKFDVIIGGMSATPKRSQTVNFTIPYAYSAVSMAANKKLAAGKTTFEDYNKPDVTLVARRGTSTAEWMKQKFPNATLRYFDDDAQAFQEVMNGNAYAFGSSEPKPSLWTLANPDILFKPFGDKRFNLLPGGFAIRKGDPDFLTFLNTWIQINTSSGWLPEREKYWFQTDGWFGEVEENPFTKKP